MGLRMDVQMTLNHAQSERADAGDRGEVQMKGRYSYPKTDTEGGTITTTYFMKPIRQTRYVEGIKGERREYE